MYSSAKISYSFLIKSRCSSFIARGWVFDKTTGFLVDVNNSDRMAEYVMEIIKNGVPYQLPEKEFLLKYDAESVANYLFELISSF